MSTKMSHVLTALCGIVGTITLVTSFVINPAPPPGLTISQLADWATAHRTLILLGGWLQGMGSLLTVIFVFALVHLAGAAQRFVGWVTFLAGVSILMVSLIEITFYISAVQATLSGDATAGTISTGLIKATQHIFLIAPALLLPLGVVILGSHILPRVLGYLALALGAALQVFGLLGLFNVLQPVIDVLLIVQSIWFLAAAITLIFRPTTTTSTSTATTMTAQ